MGPSCAWVGSRTPSRRCAVGSRSPISAGARSRGNRRPAARPGVPTGWWAPTAAPGSPSSVRRCPRRRPGRAPWSGSRTSPTRRVRDPPAAGRGRTRAAARSGTWSRYRELVGIQRQLQGAAGKELGLRVLGTSIDEYPLQGRWVAAGTRLPRRPQSAQELLDALTFVGHPPIAEHQRLHLLVPSSGVGHDRAAVGVADQDNQPGDGPQQGRQVGRRRPLGREAGCRTRWRDTRGRPGPESPRRSRWHWPTRRGRTRSLGFQRPCSSPLLC